MPSTPASDNHVTDDPAMETEFKALKISWLAALQAAAAALGLQRQAGPVGIIILATLDSLARLGQAQAARAQAQARDRPGAARGPRPHDRGLSARVPADPARRRRDWPMPLSGAAPRAARFPVRFPSAITSWSRRGFGTDAERRSP